MVHHSPVIMGQGHGDDAGPRSNHEVMSGPGLVAVTGVSHGPMMAGQARARVAGLEPGCDVSLGVKARISTAVAMHRHSWDASGARPSETDSLCLTAAPRGGRGGPC